MGCLLRYNGVCTDSSQALQPIRPAVPTAARCSPEPDLRLQLRRRRCPTHQLLIVEATASMRRESSKWRGRRWERAAPVSQGSDDSGSSREPVRGVSTFARAGRRHTGRDRGRCSLQNGGECEAFHKTNQHGCVLVKAGFRLQIARVEQTSYTPSGARIQQQCRGAK